MGRCFSSSSMSLTAGLWDDEEEGTEEDGELSEDDVEGSLENGVFLRSTPAWAVGKTDECVVIGFLVVVWCAAMEAWCSKSADRTIQACYITDMTIKQISAVTFSLIRHLPIHPTHFLSFHHIPGPHRNPICDDVTSRTSYFLATLTVCINSMPIDTQTWKGVHTKNVYQACR